MNKADAAAESVEGRGPTKGNTPKTTGDRTQGRAAPTDGLARVRAVASRDKDAKFTALLHHVTPDRLRASYFALKPKAAPGVDGMTWHEYGEGLDERLRALNDRIHAGSYRTKPSRRARIAKDDGRERLLGIAALEDKIVQRALVEILNAIYEVDFVGFSYGFRPGRSQHNALDALFVGITQRKVNWVLDADIRGYFDTIDHEWLLRFLGHRIGDRRVLRLIRKWLKAGVMEETDWVATKEGTPQGSVISPLLANVYLHYVLDLWVAQWRKRHAAGDVIVVRYADDFVVGFQHRNEAEQFSQELRERLAKFGLELNAEKTRLLEFGRYAAENRRRRGEGKPDTFDFLGFTHFCGKTRRGRFALGRKPTAKRMRRKLKEIRVKLRRRMHQPRIVQGDLLGAIYRGWMWYYAVPGTCHTLQQFRTELVRLWLATLRRRSQRGRRWNWKKLKPLAQRCIPAARILHPWPDQRFARWHPR